MAELLLYGKKVTPGKCASSSSWDCCGWACIWAPTLVCWVEPHVSLKDPSSSFKLDLSILLSPWSSSMPVWPFQCLFLEAGKEENPTALIGLTEVHLVILNAIPLPSAALLPLGWGRSLEHRWRLSARSMITTTLMLRHQASRTYFCSQLLEPFPWCLAVGTWGSSSGAI